MNKLYAFLLLCAIVVNPACKKGTTQGPVKTTKTYLLSTVIRHYNTGDETESFIYDDKNRVATRVLVNTTYKYFYDSSDRLTRIEISVIPRGLVVSYDYKYEGTTITETHTSADGSASGGYVFDTSNGKITKIHFIDKSFILYTFDSRGNIIRYQQGTKPGDMFDIGNLTYDEKKAPLSMAKGSNYQIAMSGFDPYYGLVNNILSDAFHTYTYQYNEDGFPVSGTRKRGGEPDVKFELHYLIK